MKSITWKRTDWYRTLQVVWSRWTWTKKLMELERNLHYYALTYHFFITTCITRHVLPVQHHKVVLTGGLRKRAMLDWTTRASGRSSAGWLWQGRRGYNGMGFFHSWLSSWSRLDAHLFELGPYLKLQCALVMHFETNSPNHSTSMQKDMNKPIWRETHATFKLEGVTRTYVRSRICVSWDRPPDSPSSSSRTVMLQHQAQRFQRTTTNFKRLTNPIPLRDHGEQWRCCFVLCIRGLGSAWRNSIVRILAGRTERELKEQ